MTNIMCILHICSSIIVIIAKYYEKLNMFFFQKFRFTRGSHKKIKGHFEKVLFLKPIFDKKKKPRWQVSSKGGGEALVARPLKKEPFCFPSTFLTLFRTLLYSTSLTFSDYYTLKIGLLEHSAPSKLMKGQNIQAIASQDRTEWTAAECSFTSAPWRKFYFILNQRFIFTTRSLTGHRKKNCHRPPQKLTNCKFAIYIANLFFSRV